MHYGTIGPLNSSHAYLLSVGGIEFADPTNGTEQNRAEFLSRTEPWVRSVPHGLIVGIFFRSALIVLLTSFPSFS